MSSSATPTRPHGATRVQRAIVWTALFAVPLVWVLHLLLCVTLVSSACSQGVVQHNALPWADVERLVTLASGAAFVFCLALAVASGRAWRQIVSLEPRQHDELRFVAWCSVASASAFTLGLAFTASVLIVLPLDRLCEPFR